jgi:hypothetical protein
VAQADVRDSKALHPLRVKLASVERVHVLLRLNAPAALPSYDELSDLNVNTEIQPYSNYFKATAKCSATTLRPELAAEKCCCFSVYTGLPANDEPGVALNRQLSRESDSSLCQTDVWKIQGCAFTSASQVIGSKLVIVWYNRSSVCRGYS